MDNKGRIVKIAELKVQRKELSEEVKGIIVGVRKLVAKRINMDLKNVDRYAYVEDLVVTEPPIQYYVDILQSEGKIAAGKGFDTLEAESYPAGIAATYLKAEGVPMSAVAVQIAGDSMEPEYHHGQIVIVDCKRRATRGVCCVLERMETGERMARIKKLVIRGLQATLVSLNPKYEPLPVPLENIEAFALWKG